MFKKLRLHIVNCLRRLILKVVKNKEPLGRQIIKLNYVSFFQEVVLVVMVIDVCMLTAGKNCDQKRVRRFSEGCQTLNFKFWSILSCLCKNSFCFYPFVFDTLSYASRFGLKCRIPFNTQQVVICKFSQQKFSNEAKIWIP